MSKGRTNSLAIVDIIKSELLMTYVKATAGTKRSVKAAPLNRIARKGCDQLEKFCRAIKFVHNVRLE